MAEKSNIKRTLLWQLHVLLLENERKSIVLVAPISNKQHAHTCAYHPRLQKMAPGTNWYNRMQETNVSTRSLCPAGGLKSITFPWMSRSQRSVLIFDGNMEQLVDTPLPLRLVTLCFTQEIAGFGLSQEKHVLVCSLRNIAPGGELFHDPVESAISLRPPVESASSLRPPVESAISLRPGRRWL